VLAYESGRRSTSVETLCTPARDRVDLERIAAASDELRAGLLTADQGGTRFPRHPVDKWERYDTFHLTARFGTLDLVPAPDGAAGDDDLASAADSQQDAGIDALAVTAATWERLKEASGRAEGLGHHDRFREGM
jgi:hypothetical protein